MSKKIIVSVEGVNVELSEDDLEITPLDVADYLDNEEVQKEYLTAILETGDMNLFFKALGDVAKARGMTQIAKDTLLNLKP